MKRSLIFSLSLACAVMTGCSAVLGEPVTLPQGTDNVPPSENWERMATLPGPRCTSYDGVYKVVDTEDSTIMYYAIRCGAVTGIPALAYYHEGSTENYRQVE